MQPSFRPRVRRDHSITRCCLHVARHAERQVDVPEADRAAAGDGADGLVRPSGPCNLSHRRQGTRSMVRCVKRHGKLTVHIVACIGRYVAVHAPVSGRSHRGQRVVVPSRGARARSITGNRSVCATAVDMCAHVREQMEECAYCLHNVTPTSLVLIDELGRGTDRSSKSERRGHDRRNALGHWPSSNHA